MQLDCLNKLPTQLQTAQVQIPVRIWAYIMNLIFCQKVGMSEKCCNNNSDDRLTPRRTDGGKNPSHIFQLNSGTYI